jgi:hypothetical protein
MGGGFLPRKPKGRSCAICEGLATSRFPGVRGLAPAARQRLGVQRGLPPAKRVGRFVRTTHRLSLPKFGRASGRRGIALPSVFGNSMWISYLAADRFRPALSPPEAARNSPFANSVSAPFSLWLGGMLLTGGTGLVIPPAFTPPGPHGICQRQNP